MAGPRDDIADEARALRRASRRTQRIWLAAIVGNLLVAAALLGGPYARARSRALAGRAQFARFAACMTGGTPLDGDIGLGLPEGSPESYVDRFRTDPAWPSVCADSLRRVAPDDSFWLLPDVRHAEGETRRAVEMVLGELDDAEGADRDGPVPERPWLAMQRLVAALTLWAREADVRRGLLEPAIVVAEPTTVIPTRVPLEAASSARLTARARGDGLEVVAIDTRGISWVRVGGGRTDVRRMRRPSLVRGAVFGETPWIVWAMDGARCGDDRCARRAMGVAPLADDPRTLPEPVWVAAHPIRPSSSAIRITDDTIDVIARDTSGISLREFTLSALVERQDAASDDAVDADGSTEDGDADRPMQPTSARVAAGVHDARLGPHGVYGLRDGVLLAIHEGDERILGGDGLTWIEGAYPVFVGGATGIWVASAELRPVDDVPPLVPPRLVLSSREQSEESEQRVSALIGRDTDGTLHAVLCDFEACVTESLGSATAFDAGLVEGALIVAHVDGEDGAIRLHRLERDGLTPVAMPSACWSEQGGLCGEPTVVFADSRILLGARDRTDLLVVESADGMTWSPMRGLY